MKKRPAIQDQEKMSRRLKNYLLQCVTLKMRCLTHLQRWMRFNRHQNTHSPQERRCPNLQGEHPDPPFKTISMKSQEIVFATDLFETPIVELSRTC
jgi:hypothetical protein